MSIIVWDGESLACDGASNDGLTKIPVEKLWGVAGTVAYGGVGNVHDLQAMRLWVEGDMKPENFPIVGDDCHFLLATKARGLIRYTTKPYALVHGRAKCAFGTGRQFAIGALDRGATAIEAVETASKYDPYCGLGVFVFHIGKED